MGEVVREDADGEDFGAGFAEEGGGGWAGEVVPGAGEAAVACGEHDGGSACQGLRGRMSHPRSVMESASAKGERKMRKWRKPAS